jgi:hypothetical protein
MCPWPFFPRTSVFGPCRECRQLPADWASQEHRQRAPLLDGIGGPNYLAVSKANAWEIVCDFNDPARRKMINESYVLPPCEKIPQQAAFGHQKFHPEL